MKNILGSMALLTVCTALAAAPITSADKVQFKGGKVLVLANGAAAEATDNVALPLDILVSTNGTFTVKKGAPRKLEEGDTLDRNGMLLRADGTITPVIDHVAMDRGRVMVMKDGVRIPLTGTLKLGDGSVIHADGHITPLNGVKRLLLDGELYRLEGGTMAARDTISMQNGRVTVQKDGAVLNVERDRSITMNDGTKVFGDGTIVKFNGERSKLREGQTIVVEGVKRR